MKQHWPVNCKICGKELKRVCWSHLRVHNLTYKEYRRLYPHADVGLQGVGNHKGTNPQKISETLKKHYQDPRYKRSHGFQKGHKFIKGGEKGWIKKGQRLSPSTEFKKGQRYSPNTEFKKGWWDPKIFKKHLKGLLERPTSFEQKIINLCNRYNLPFKYVGDGELFIARKNPDFIESNGKKLLIETYYSYFKPDDYEETRSSIFSKYGFRTLFLNENDIRRRDWEDHCLTKVRQFMGD